MGWAWGGRDAAQCRVFCLFGEDGMQPSAGCSRPHDGREQGEAWAFGMAGIVCGRIGGDLLWEDWWGSFAGSLCGE